MAHLAGRPTIHRVGAFAVIDEASAPSERDGDTDRQRQGSPVLEDHVATSSNNSPASSTAMVR